MGDVSYRPIMEDMIWSHSRIGAYEDCPYKFFLKYIKDYKDTDMFYASYGSFIHKLIESYYLGLLTKEDMLSAFLSGFSAQVKGDRPSEKIVSDYIQYGIQYMKQFQPFPFRMVAVEKKINFSIDGINMVGILDYIGEKDGKLYIVDNKSRNLRHRSGRKKPTKYDEELDAMLRQLYLYAEALKQEYGQYPESLCFNCFRNQTFIEEPFVETVCKDVVSQTAAKVREIMDADDFHPNWEFFPCSYLCGVSQYCCYDEMQRKEKRR